MGKMTLIILLVAASVAIATPLVLMKGARTDEFVTHARDMPQRLLSEKVLDLSLADFTDEGVLLSPRGICRIKTPPYMGGKLVASYRANADTGSAALFYGVYTESGQLVGGGMGSAGMSKPSSGETGIKTQFTRLSSEKAKNSYMLFVNEGDVPIRLYVLRAEFIDN